MLGHRSSALASWQGKSVRARAFTGGCINMHELLGIAILAYRSSRYWDAIDLLNQIEREHSTNWLAKLYLGMCYQRCGYFTTAADIFKSLSEECTDKHVAVQAQNAYELIQKCRVKSSQAEPPLLTKAVRRKPENWGNGMAV
jgi:tetratricopeptide (TPR) repeat protein